MSSFRASVQRCFGVRVWAIIAALAAVALAGSPSAFAGLIGTNYYVRYDGSVRNNGSVGVEGHSNTLPFGTNNIPTHEIPVTVNPPAPLNPARVLTVTETAFTAPMSTTHVILDIQGKFSAGGPDVFANNLDPNLAFPVVFEGRFYDSDPTKALVLDLNKVINAGGVFHDTVELENVGMFYKLPLAQKQVSGSGTQADPLRVILNIPASMVSVNRGRVKVHLYLGQTDSNVIPEPTTAFLVLIGLTGVGLAWRRDERG